MVTPPHTPKDGHPDALRDGHHEGMSESWIEEASDQDFIDGQYANPFARAARMTWMIDKARRETGRGGHRRS